MERIKMNRNVVFIFAASLIFISQAYGYQTVSTMSGLTTALSQIGSNEDGITMTRGTYTLTSNLTIAENISLRMERGAIFVLGSYTLTIHGELEAGLYQIFNYNSTGVVAGTPKIKFVYPQWWGAHNKNDYGFENFDSTNAIQYAINFAYQSGSSSVKISDGCYFKASTITLKAAVALVGDGLWSSGLMAIGREGSGPFITDDGSAAKICISDLSIYGLDHTEYTAGVELGFNSYQWGTEGLIQNTIVRDFPNGSGFRINGNVGVMIKNSVWWCKRGLTLYGAGNLITSQIDSGCTEYGMYLAAPSSIVTGYYTEPDETGMIPIYVDRGNIVVNNACISVDVDIAIPCVAEVNSIEGGDFVLTGVSNFMDSGASITTGVRYTTQNGYSQPRYDYQQNYISDVPAAFTLNQNYVTNYKTGNSANLNFPILNFYGIIPSTAFLIRDDLTSDIILGLNIDCTKKVNYTYSFVNNSTTKTVWLRGMNSLFARVEPKIEPITDGSNDLYYCFPVRPKTALTIRVDGSSNEQLMAVYSPHSTADFTGGSSATYGPYSSTGWWLRGEIVYQQMSGVASGTYVDVLYNVCITTGLRGGSPQPVWKKIKVVN